jgi:glycerol-3-phosphate dehydrogenase
MIYDLAVIGAGYTGLGVALAAQEQGLSVVVIEQGEIGSGASANSHRIVHGGFRYLQKLNLKRARASACAQAEILKRYSAYVKVLPCYMPLNPWGLKSKWPVRCALLLFRLVSFGISAPRVPIGKVVKPESLPQEWQEQASYGALLWHDVSVQDYRGLIEAIASEVKSKSGQVLTSTRVVQVLKEDSSYASLLLEGVDGELTVNARTIANCIGAWHGLRAEGEPSPFGEIAWIKAFNIVLRKQLPIDAAFAFASKVKKGALYFLVPRMAGSAIGTVYSENEVSLDEMTVSSDEVAEVLQAVGESFNDLKLSFSDVKATEVGLLPAKFNVGKSCYELLEKDQVVIAGNFADVLAVKFTTFLTLGRQVVSQLLGSKGSRS